MFVFKAPFFFSPNEVLCDYDDSRRKLWSALDGLAATQFERTWMMGDCNVKTISIDGVDYVRADMVQKPVSGKRAVLVLDRGWIVAGDIEDKDGRIKVTRALHVRSWSSVGFDGMIANPKSNVVIKPFPNGFDCPADAELFRVPVGDNWGL